MSIDLTDPLPYAAESFGMSNPLENVADMENPPTSHPDVVHIRNLSSSIGNYQLLIERCARILRTSGMLVVTELELFYVRQCCLSSSTASATDGRIIAHSTLQVHHIPLQPACGFGTQL